MASQICLNLRVVAALFVFLEPLQSLGRGTSVSVLGFPFSFCHTSAPQWHRPQSAGHPAWPPAYEFSNKRDDGWSPEDVGRLPKVSLLCAYRSHPSRKETVHAVGPEGSTVRNPSCVKGPLPRALSLEDTSRGTRVSGQSRS